MSKKLISILFVFILAITGCAGTHFGVADKALQIPPDVVETEDAIAKSEKSPGAKYCPEKIAKARAMAKEAMDVYWACHTAKALGMLADARKIAKEAESCGPPVATAPAPLAPAPMPAPAPVTVVRQPISFHTVTFDFDKSDLKPAARAELDRATKVMAENPNVVLELQGNTDSVGTDDYNMALGHRRAEAVFKYLNAKGIKSDRLKETSFGEGKPAATNETDAGRTLNRRVDLVILK